MSESPVDKTSRKLADILKRHCFDWQATVYLTDASIEGNIQQIARIKKMITKDNPDKFILCFISHSANRVTGELQPYICFYSWKNLTGTSLRAAQDTEKFRIVGERNDQPKRTLISRTLRIDQVEGLNKIIRKEKIYDLHNCFGDYKFRRFSFINSKCKPNAKELVKIREDFIEKRDELYASRMKKKTEK